MTFKMMKVIDSQRPSRMPRAVFEAACLLNGELHGNGNDSYMPFKIVEKPDEHKQGGGYLTENELSLLTHWLLTQGAEVGETVLLKVWW